MKARIFENGFTLKFLKEEIEHEFDRIKIASLMYYNKTIMIGLFLVSVGISLMNSFFLDNLNSAMFQCVLYSSYITNFIMFIFLFFSCYCKNVNVIRYIHYINYYLIWLISINFRYTLLRILKVEIVVYFVITIEIILRLIWVLFGVHGFMETFILNCVSIASMWILYPTIFDKIVYGNEMLNLFGYSIALITIMIFAYIIVRKERTASYFHWMIDKERKWLYNVFENMKCGFLALRNESVIYLNTYLIKQIEKIKNGTTDSRLVNNNFGNLNNSRILNTEAIELVLRYESENFQYDTNCKKMKFNQSDAIEMIKSLLTKINTDSLIDPLVSQIMSDFKKEIENNDNSRYNFMKTFAKHVSKINEIETFKVIGDNEIIFDDIEISFELHCRYIRSAKNDNEIEFLFNDVTRAKQKEKQNAEFKYKTLFLSKVSHEFKNPIICITELVNQVEENLENMENTKDNFNKSKNLFLSELKQIKSLSNFLLILVKDLNYFAENQQHKDNTPIKKEEDIKEIITFVKEVAVGLIKKSNKSEIVEFITQIDENIPDKILTDQWRLKQVLINLISNAVKFTLFGKIVLDVSLEERDDNKQFIKFLVSDTGIGIKQEEQLKLFSPFSKGKTNTNLNEMGSGLGLNIANEIASKLGEKVSFSSVVEKGSKFWFYVICPEEMKIKYKKSSNKVNDIMSIVLEKGNDSLIKKTENLDRSKDLVSIDFIPSIIKDEIIIITKPKIDLSRSKNKKHSKKGNKLIKTNSQTSFNKKEHNSNNYSLVDFIFNDVSNLRKIENINVYNFNINNNNVSEFNLVKKEIFIKNNFINIIVVDDEKMTRLSTIRILKSVSKDLGLKINIIEAEDGVECIYLVYKSFSQGVKISMIFSDENMKFINGSISSVVVKDMLNKKNLNEIPFYLVTAYDNNSFDQNLNSTIKKIITKPIMKDVAKEIIYEYLGNLTN